MKTKCVGEALPKLVAGWPILAAICNNQVVPLSTPSCGAATISPLTQADAEGFVVYRATCAFLLAKCAAEVASTMPFRIRHSAGAALSFSWAGDVVALEKSFRALIAADLPITVSEMYYGEACDLFKQRGAADQLNLLEHRNPPQVSICSCGDFHSLLLTPLAPRTGVIGHFELLPGPGGFLLNLPSPQDPTHLPNLTEIVERGGYLSIFHSHLKHGELTGVKTVGDLNRILLEKRFPDFVYTCEIMQRRALADIADKIVSRRPEVRLVLVAGPSSAGKTTTARNLAFQLRAAGKVPLAFSTDDYFVGDARNPRDAAGNLDYECVEAVDRARLRQDIHELLAGKAVHLRQFNFIKHEGFDAPEVTQLPSDGIIVLEGIHALNPILTQGIEDNLKFRVYLNTLTQLSVDNCTRISTSDTRLLRRIVRDYNYRGCSPKMTFTMWPSVMLGERKWIYPYQLLADAVFNSALDYELAILKPFALQLLSRIKPTEKEYLQASRLMAILENVAIAQPDAVPKDSILRESIGM